MASKACGVQIHLTCTCGEVKRLTLLCLSPYADCRGILQITARCSNLLAPPQLQALQGNQITKHQKKGIWYTQCAGGDGMMGPSHVTRGKEAEPAASSTGTGCPPKVWVLKAFCSCPFPGEGGGVQ